jgi:hypothetical protein
MNIGHAPKPSTQPGKQPATKGVTVVDVLAVFPGAKVIAKDKPLSCVHCSKENVPEWRRGGKIVEIVEPDGSRAWCCHFCGRRVRA